NITTILRRFDTIIARKVCIDISGPGDTSEENEDTASSHLPDEEDSRTDDIPHWFSVTPHLSNRQPVSIFHSSTTPLLRTDSSGKKEISGTFRILWDKMRIDSLRDQKIHCMGFERTGRCRVLGKY
ncbi:hypothetical protein TNCT_115601, partial [Trichonephila clavata]